MLTRGQRSRDQGQFFLRSLNVLKLTIAALAFSFPFSLIKAEDLIDTSLLPPEDILYLVYNYTKGDGWNEKGNWTTSNDVCSYYGVTCYPADYAIDSGRQGHVRVLDLSSNHLVGIMPSVVFTLPYLEKLVLRDNGDLDVDLSQVAQAQYLIELVLSDTLVKSITGIRNATSLKYLHLTGLGMTGPFPDDIYQLSNLVGLYANYNNFGGKLSSAIGGLFHLEELFLFNNHLEGTIPSSIGKLANLRTLSLGQNAFSGHIPEALNRCFNLEVLAIHRLPNDEKGAGITGPMLAFADLENLVQVDLQNQKLSGPLPSNLLASASLTDPIMIDLTNNEISGSIPASLVSKQRLSLFLAGNKISNTSLTPDFCSQVPGWMGGDVEQFGCSALLCPDGTAAPEGRNTGSNTSVCHDCSLTSGYLGATSCPFGPSGTLTLSDQRSILIEFFNSMKGQYWASATNWLSATANVCTWKGIGCTTDGYVNSIQLRNNDLTGTPAESLFHLPELAVLDLSSNSITFDFRPVGSATKLSVLSLSQTDTNSLNDIGFLSLTAITKLSLSTNAIQGTLPTDLFLSTTLQQLDVSNNDLTGTLPTQIGALSSLVRFYCFGNRFTGQLPTQVGKLVNLVELWAGDNNFGGVLPSELNNLAKLEELTLHQLSSLNGIGGPLFDFNGLQQLTSLQLAGNSLTGTLSSFMLDKTQRGNDRIELLLNGNELQGTIPSAWANRFADLYVDLTDNQITGIDNELCLQKAWMDDDVSRYGCNAVLCPSGTFNEVGRQSTETSICNTCSTAQYYGATTCSGVSNNVEFDILRSLFAETNGPNWVNHDNWGTTGDVCSWHGIDCDLSGRVLGISLQSNGLSGTFPTSVYRLPALQVLVLAENQISFSFNGIANASSLITLDLAGVGLNSIDGIGSAVNLEEINLTDNDLTGSIPSELFGLRNLRHLMLNYNQLTGRIPTEIAALSNLQGLFLLHNRLTGQLPAALGSLVNLRVLTLAENTFDGTIPPEFNMLTNLEILSIQRDSNSSSQTDNQVVDQGPMGNAGTGLTGALPSFNTLTRLKALFLGVNSLSGTIPGDFLDGIANKSAMIEIDLISNKLSGELPAALVRFDRMSLLVADNQISGIADSLCKQTEWMEGKVKDYDCSAILCPPNTTSVYGRQIDETSTCIPCPLGTTAPYWGSFTCGGSAYRTAIEEYAILGEFWHSTHGDQWIFMNGWMAMDVPICQWYGISCNAVGDAVESINLLRNGLVGSIPSSIYHLRSLKELTLAGNNINMTFAGIGSASMLEYVNLDSTGLNSLMYLNSAPNLKTLIIDGNDFGDVFPSQLLLMTGLDALYLSQNRIGATLPPLIANLKSLSIFECSDCGFESTLPSTIGSLVKLQYLRLDSNSFYGTIPTEISSLSLLKLLDLSNQIPSTRSLAGNFNNVTEIKPVGFEGGLSALTDLSYLSNIHLSNNRLSGEIPNTLLGTINGSTPVLIDLRNNEINGSLPTSWQRIQTMNIDLSNNKISSIPSELCSLTWNEKSLTDSNCDFILCNKGTISGTGRATKDTTCTSCPNASDSPYYGGITCGTDLEVEILDQLFSELNGINWNNAEGWELGAPVCSRYGVTCDSNSLVQVLDLHDNNLLGMVTSRIWLLTKMQELNLGQNSIDLEFSQIDANEGLNTLELSRTNVKSLTNLSKAHSLTSLYVADNDITGSIPLELFDLTELKSLYLNYNKFSGTITSSISNLSLLEELHLFSNNLSGKLPESLARLTKIKVLSLGANKFTGELPSAISYLPVLESLSLQSESPDTDAVFGLSTGISGSLPSFHMTPNLRELYLGSNNFEGSVPDNFLAGVRDKSTTIRVDLHNNNLAGSIPTTLTAFKDLRLDLANNQITDIPTTICAMSDWMGGLVATGCDAILCPPGFYNKFGMRILSEDCSICTFRGAALYYGSTFCGAILPGQGYSERQILEELYTATDGASWNDRTNWMSESSVCTWAGVDCVLNAQKAEVVNEISLPSNNLRGYVPSVIFYLPSLTKLNLEKNDIRISFHDIGNSPLEEIYIGSTGLSTIEGLGGMSNLRIFHMENNSFRGQNIPDELFNLTSLEDLDISVCGFVGSLPSTISRWSDLEYFSAINNELEGELPEQLFALSNLKSLRLSDNAFFGTLPQISNISFIETIALDKRAKGGAGLSGPLPTFASLPNLINLDLGANTLTGSIPENFLSEVATNDDFINVFLDSNVLTGTVPSVLSRFDKLNINLAGNEIEAIGDGICSKSQWWNGELGKYSNCSGLLCPKGTFNLIGREYAGQKSCEKCPGSNSPYLGSLTCPSLEKLYASDILRDLFRATNGDTWKNKDGWMSESVDICLWHGIQCGSQGNIERVILGGNNLAGSVPSSIFELPGLQMLWLYSNPITLSFNGIEKALSLTSLQLDSIGLKSLEGIGKAPVLVDIDVRFNSLTGSLPSELDSLIYLETFFCSDNALTGTVPSFSNNKRLTAIRFGGNNFVGSLPSLSVHPVLRSLDASGNMLTGGIPDDFLAAADTSKPVYLDISSNELSGFIPASLNRFSEFTIYGRNNRFEGIHPDLCIKVNWNGGDVGVFGCDGILCPSQSYSREGRASKDGSQCLSCQSAEFFGTIACESTTSSSSSLTIDRLIQTVLLSILIAWLS